RRLARLGRQRPGQTAGLKARPDRTEHERREFASTLSANPEAGDAAPESGGVRKVWWKCQGTGKSGGVRVIHFARNQAGEWVFLSPCAKSKTILI
ncbi:MAG: hypothetical protein ACO32I_08670, partial [Candidatus Limnocylindrus sp.]